MKKLAGLFVVILAMGVAGCSSSSSDSNWAGATTTATGAKAPIVRGEVKAYSVSEGATEYTEIPSIFISNITDANASFILNKAEAEKILTETKRPILLTLEDGERFEAGGDDFHGKFAGVIYKTEQLAFPIRMNLGTTMLARAIKANKPEELAKLELDEARVAAIESIEDYIVEIINTATVSLQSAGGLYLTKADIFGGKNGRTPGLVEERMLGALAALMDGGAISSADAVQKLGYCISL